VKKEAAELSLLLDEALSADGYIRKPALASLLCECIRLDPKRFAFLSRFSKEAASLLSLHSPLLLLSLGRNDEKKAAWNAFIRENRENHRALNAEKFDILPFDTQEKKAMSALGRTLLAEERGEKLKDFYNELADEPLDKRESDSSSVNLPALYREASDRLLEAGFLASKEMRHEASLAPLALLREWSFDTRVFCGKSDYSLAGTACAYGRGLSLWSARVSCIMEIVERASAYASVGVCDGEAFVLDRKTDMPLVFGRYADLVKAGKRVLDPALLPLDVPPRDLPLYWVSGKTGRDDEILVPYQAVFLFSNLHEPELMNASGSTGLAAGGSLAQAKVNALLELLERDAESTVPFLKERAFVLQSRDPVLQSLLDDYQARMIRVQFLDLTHEFGIPVYQAFVTSVDGRVVRAQACKLNGKDCAMAALTETPWPYSLRQPAPYGQPSGPGLSTLPTRCLEELPNYDLGSSGRNLKLLERRLYDLGYEPIYVDITRSDLSFPVVRALIPRFELSADADPSSHIPRRLLARLHAWRDKEA
ncbi:MAG: YcaO-like family protein, partial [Desulfovibrio sp.]|nr:YcaO-like family protein [Desulfovibrio sp.]